ncbi:MAG: hypothetical protein UR83_C0065G0004 [Candidatus Moranbacteria bacterium GW2011_GWF2_35_54]|nr:MAG: hypothetical protein UR83_C0065G0004 [Candidatus Moranbacteria bacterium GW2011_GWF2_35_54]
MDILTGSIPVVFLNNIWQTLTVAWFSYLKYYGWILLMINIGAKCNG